MATYCSRIRCVDLTGRNMAESWYRFTCLLSSDEHEVGRALEHALQLMPSPAAQAVHRMRDGFPFHWHGDVSPYAALKRAGVAIERLAGPPTPVTAPVDAVAAVVGARDSYLTALRALVPDLSRQLPPPPLAEGRWKLARAVHRAATRRRKPNDNGPENRA